MSPVIIGFENQNHAGSFDILTANNLQKLGISRSEICTITPFFAVHGSLYPEYGVASSTHPCAGSVGINITTNDGKIYGVDEIFYYDYNPHRSHAAGSEHWNHERRLRFPNNELQIIKQVEHHIIPASDEIKIYIIDDKGLQKEQIVKKLQSNS